MHSRLATAMLVLGLAALLGHATAGRAGAQPATPGHQEILNSINTWSRTLPAADRFVLVMGGEAVFDKETGLVWEQAPNTNPATDNKTWAAARSFCNNTKTVGNRKAWRLPTVHELASLVDPSVSASGPTLPPGHPFDNVSDTAQPSFAFWSATSQDLELTRAWFVDLRNANVFTLDKVPPAGVTLFAWCVRGGHFGTDTQ